MFIDSHTHLYLNEFAIDRSEVIQRALDTGVKRFYLPAIDSTHTKEMFQLESDFPEYCFAMMGLHPCSVNADYEKEIVQVEKWLSKRKFVAIGEIGLDFYWSKEFVQQQFQCFNRQMELAVNYNLPIVIHSRNATRECIDLIKPFAGKGFRGIFHCFGGTIDEAKEIIGCGFMLGIGGVLTYKNSGLDIILKNIPLSSIVLETDSPYLTPVPYRGKRNQSSYLIYIAEKLAAVKGISLKEVEDQTTINANTVFKTAVVE